MALNTNIPFSIPASTPNFNCDVSGAVTPEDNETYISSFEIPLVECDDIPLDTSKNFFNCNLCGSDEPYWQPVADGDTVREQIAINTNTYKTFKAYLFDSDDNVLDQNITLAEFEDAAGNKYLNISFAGSDITASCFYWKIYAYETEINEGTLATCVAARLPGISEHAAEITCAITQSPDYAEFYSEEYKKIDTACEDTLVVQGYYPRYDCDGNYYGTAETGTNAHALSFRIYGNIEKSEYNFEETLVFNTRRTSKQNSTFNLRTPKIPPYVVEKLAKAFNSQYVKIDGIAYKRGVKLSKNFEEGSMWIIDTTLQRDCDEIDFLC